MWKQQMMELEKHFDKELQRVLLLHPYLGFLLVFLGMPLFILLAVCICTIAISIPMSFIFGW